MIEFGVITDIDYKTSTANVTIEGMEDYSLENVPVMQQLSNKSKSFIMPDIGTHVIIGFSEDKRAVIIGCTYSEIDQSPSESNKFIKSFSDGTVIEYDIENSKLTATVKGTASITLDGDAEVTTSNNLTLKASKITLDGEIEATGKITANAEIEATGEIVSTTDVKTNGISLLTHTHTGNQGAPTSPPIVGGA